MQKKLIGTALSVVLCASMLAGMTEIKKAKQRQQLRREKTMVIGDTTI
mgnify:CR=1 FL=1